MERLRKKGGNDPPLRDRTKKKTWNKPMKQDGYLYFKRVMSPNIECHQSSHSCWLNMSQVLFVNIIKFIFCDIWKKFLNKNQRTLPNLLEIGTIS